MKTLDKLKVLSIIILIFSIAAAGVLADLSDSFWSNVFMVQILFWFAVTYLILLVIWVLELRKYTNETAKEGYIILTDTIGGLEAMWYLNNEVMFFPSERAAEREIKDLIDSVEDSFKQGYISDTTSRDEYVIVPAQRTEDSIFYDYGNQVIAIDRHRKG